jgi:hypothetical protein
MSNNREGPLKLGLRGRGLGGGHGCQNIKQGGGRVMKNDFCCTTAQDEHSVVNSCSSFVVEKGQLFTFGDARHGKLGLNQESYSNQYIPRKSERFLKFTVSQVSSGGSRMQNDINV